MYCVCSQLSNTPTEEDVADIANLQFKVCTHPSASFMMPVLWKLAMKSLRPGEWKKLARRWHFTEDHIVAIEHQYTGQAPYRNIISVQAMSRTLIKH
jgi:hypothetical protein